MSKTRFPTFKKSIPSTSVLVVFSYAGLLDLLQYHFKVTTSADCLRHIIARMKSMKSVVGIPKEVERVNVALKRQSEFYLQRRRDRIVRLQRQARNQGGRPRVTPGWNDSRSD
jgi:Mg-chelatase subunit ChlI